MIAAIVVITIAFFRDDTSAVAKEAQLIVISRQDCTAASSISVGIAGAVAIFTPDIIAAFIGGTFGICIAFFITVVILLFELRLQLLDFAGCTAASESKENRCTNKDKYSQLIADDIAADGLTIWLNGNNIFGLLFRNTLLKAMNDEARREIYTEKVDADCQQPGADTAEGRKHTGHGESNKRGAGNQKTAAIYEPFHRYTSKKYFPSNHLFYKINTKTW